MNGYEIRHHMSQNNVLVKDLANQFGIRNVNISKVIHGKRKTKYIREAIAKAIKKPVSEVFTDVA